MLSPLRSARALVAVGFGISLFACGSGISPGTGGSANTGSGAASGTTSGTTTGTGGIIACNEAGGAIPPLKLTQVASGLSEPAFVTSAPADAKKLYVVELDGRIQIVENGAVSGTFLDITSIVHDHQGSEEWGLLGLAFHPKFAENGRFFVYFTDDSNDNHIAEFKRSAADPSKADPTPVKTFAIPLSTNAYNHNGGMLAFGPDGMLYAGVGDTAVGPGPGNPAEDTSSNLGKILRIDVDSDAPPAGNVAGYVWDYGLRNPWRFSFDACTGDLYIGDVGEDAWEEIDVEPKGAGGKDYGWSTMEGSHCLTGSSCGVKGVAPVLDYDHATGVSVTGGYVYRGSAIGGLQGVYLYADFGTRRVWSFRYAAGGVSAKQDLSSDLDSQSLAGIASFGEDAAGNLYVVDIGGAIFRIDAE